MARRPYLVPRKKERENYALGRELRKGAVYGEICLYTLPQPSTKDEGVQAAL